MSCHQGLCPLKVVAAPNTVPKNGGWGGGKVVSVRTQEGPRAELSLVA